MGLPTDPPHPATARAPPPGAGGGEHEGQGWLN